MRNLLSNLTLQPERAINGVKTGLACLIGLLLMWSANFPTGQWLVITIVVVMSGQVRLGGAIKKAYMRMLGTIIAAIISATAIYYLGTDRQLLTAVIVLSVICFSYISTSETDISEMGTLGGVTVVLILANDPVSLTHAGYRLVEIMLGITIALLVSSLIYPIYAKNSLRNKIALLLRKMSSLYQLHLNPLTEANTDKLIALEDEIAKAFVAQNKLVAESKAEVFSKGMPQVLLKQIIRTERRIYRSMYLVSQSLMSINYASLPDICVSTIKNFNDTVVVVFAQLEKALDGKQETVALPMLSDVLKDIDSLSYLLKQASDTYPIAELHAFQFCAKSLMNHIHELEELLKEFVARK